MWRPISSTIRSASAATSSASCTFSTRIMNSSPPSRATKSPARATRLIREATSRSTSSPTAWPNVSLARLKSSRSTNSTARPTPLRRDRARARSSASPAAARLCSPVSASWVACCSRFFCSWSRSRIDPDSTCTDRCSDWPSRPGSGLASDSDSKSSAASALALASSSRRLAVRSSKASNVTAMSRWPWRPNGGWSRSPALTASARTASRCRGSEIDRANHSDTTTVSTASAAANAIHRRRSVMAASRIPRTAERMEALAVLMIL